MQKQEATLVVCEHSTSESWPTMFTKNSQPLNLMFPVLTMQVPARTMCKRTDSLRLYDMYFPVVAFIGSGWIKDIQGMGSWQKTVYLRSSIHVI